MKNKETILHFASRVLVVFALIMIFLLVLGPIFGDQAQGVSVLFELGGQGVSFKVMLQALGMSFLVNIVQALFLSNFLAKKMMLLWRTALMFICIFAGGGIWGSLFRWFPADKPTAWLSYLLSFGAASVLSILVMILKTKLENEKVNRKLQEYKRQKQKEKNS